MDDLISVVINVFNGEKFIKKCLDSIVNQTYKNLDILIVNDGSTDSTLSICQNYKDERIRLITTENMGLSKSRNIGIENAKGEYLYFVDVDDFVDADTIEYLYNLCKRYGTQMATCKPMTIFDYNYIVKNKKEKVEIISSKEMLGKVLLSRDRAVTIWNKLIKKELFDNIRFEDRPINDVAFTYKLVIQTEKIAYSNQQKYYYLRHKESVTAKDSQNLDRAIDNYKVSVDRYNYINDLYPDFLENNIGMIRTIIKLYLNENTKSQDFFYEQKADKFFKELFSFKLLLCNIGIKEKINILIFSISPKLYKIIVLKYRKIKYKYKM